MRLIKLPPRSPTVAQTVSQPYYATSAWHSRPHYTTTPRNFYHVNPSVSGSSRFNTYANSEQNLNEFTATDFNIVSVAPKHTHQPYGAAYTTIPPPIPMSYDYRDSNYHSTMHTEMPAATHHHAVHNFPNPHTFRRNYINSYYGSAGPPRFVPYPMPPPQYPYPYSQPDTSIVTLSYPNSSPDKPSTMILNQINEITSQSTTTTEIVTVPTPVTSTVAYNVTEKPKIIATTAETNVTQKRPNKNSKTRHKPTKDNVKSNTINHPKDDFEAEDEEYEDEKNANEEEPEEENENEDFENYNFEDENEPAANETSKYTNPKKIPSRPPNDNKNEDDVNDNEETELEYTFEEEDPEDEAEKNEKETEKEEDEVPDEKGEEKEDDDHIVKPPTAFYKRFITDELDNPFAKPDFDMNRFLTDLAKPIEVPGETKKVKIKKKRPDRLVDSKPENSNRNISRKQDRIVRLQLYDETPQTIIKRPRATKPSQAPNKNVVPLAVVHTYKPANHSYPARYQLHLPTNYNLKTYNSFRPVKDKTYDYKPYNTGTLGPNYYRYPTYSNENGQNQNDNSTDYAEESCGGRENSCNEEEEEEEEYANEEETPAENDENVNAQDNEEYYDDYASDYTDGHLQNPLTPPKIPSIPKKLQNIDKEVTSPPVESDDDTENEELEQNEEPEQNEEDNANEEVENEAPEEENEEHVDSNQQTADGEETIISSQQYKTPQKHSAHYTGKAGNSFVDHVTIPHRQNKLLKNPTTELSNNHVTALTKLSNKLKSTLNYLPAATTPTQFTDYLLTTYRTPIIRSTMATYHSKVKQNDYKDKIKPRTNKTRTSTEIIFQNPVNPTLSYTTSNLITNPAPPRKTEQRYGNKTKANSHKYSNQDDAKSNYKITDASRIRSTQKTSTAHW